MTQIQQPAGGSSDESRQHPEPHHINIQIDRAHYVVTQSQMTGAELRSVPPTPIGPERDVFEVVPGASDRKIADTDVVALRNGKRFFTAPAQINPGSR